MIYKNKLIGNGANGGAVGLMGKPLATTSIATQQVELTSGRISTKYRKHRTNPENRHAIH